ncbi:hypothetical protein VOLCADRAFT_116740 [Volvox carteri f. nagariensis]|uniref:UBC core domain-containing protein n=1 Tax=Volvox carteri f. nagariensis TaxID=3068 RepID=D8TP82_VOLCA|nr:uncharacterized protein VOLCADRAFT_116740 [Volvox carteri f. nagariensis]EFJ50717.1 hypothetical protein VOLCADRAFT_116740 [Volvox carteri f. nagariensis]|eukprot:XP_002948310.1 hypothetical protein VOLCADRAFT_116740 [Volvox carteri f. nagariensis]
MDPPAQDGDFTDEDMELQLALALSLQPAGGVDLASLLQQFLAGHMPPPQQQFQQQQQQPAQDAAAALAAAAMAALGGAPFGQTAASAAASGSATASTGASRPPPGWAARLQAWYNSAKAPAAFSAGSAMLAGPEQLQAFLGHLATALQIKVVADSTAIAAGTLFLKTATTAGGSREVTAESLRGLLASALLQRKVAPKDKLQAIHRVHGTLPSPASLPGDGAGGVAAALELFSGVLCREAIALLRDDGADLYFDTGAQTTAFVDALAGGSATMSEVFLDSLLDASATEREAAVWRRLMRDAIRSAFAPAAKLTDAAGFERPLAVLDRVTSTHRLQQCLSAMLLEDVEAAARARPGQAAKALEQSCVLASLFGASPMPNSQDALHFYKVTSPARQAFLETRGYPKNYSAGQTCRTVLQAMMARVQDGAGHLMLRLSRVKDGGLSREALLSWVAAVGRVNVVRRAFGEAQEMRNQQDVADFLAGGSDGFLLNVTGGCLRLAQPFVNGWLDLYRNGADPLAATAAAAAGGSTLQPLPRFADLFDKHLRPEYYRTQRHRLGDLSGVYNAQGSRGSGGFTADDDPPTTAPPLLVPGDMVGGEGSPSFMADVFFLTQLMMHVGPIPCVYRRRAILHRFRQRYQMEMGAAAGANGDGGLDPSEVRSGRDPWANPLATEMRLYDDCCESHLNEPLFADNLTAFAVLELDWMAWLSRGGAGDPSVVMRLVPEYALGDALDWLTAVLYAGRADLVASKPIAVIMRAMVTLLNANDVVRSAMLQNKIINLLLAMLASQLQNVQAREARGLALAPDRMSTGERALRDLIPALLRAHVNAELVVGLDVDKDSYDKYGMRYHIDKILEELIKDSVLKRCLTDLAATTSSGPTEALLPANAAASASSSGSSAVEPGLFSDYASGIVNTVMHYFKDGLDRLADIYAIERSKADAAAWEAQPAEERQRKEDFYRGQQRAAVGFLSMGVANLKWLNTLTADPLIATAFLHEPLLGKTAFLVVSSLELLLGDACKKLQVKKPEQYGFDLPVLVGAVLALQLQLGRNDRFVQAVVSEPDYSEEHLETHHQALLETRLRTFLARAAELRGTGLGAGGDGLVVPLSGTADAAAGEASPGADSQPPLKRRKSGEGSGVEPMEAEPRRPTGLYCEAVRVPGPDLTEAEVEKLYAAELGPLSIGEYDSSVPGGYFKEMARLAEQDSGASRKKMRQLAKEVNDMQPGGRLALPCMAAAAIYLRQDSARVDKMRAVITGPEGTPYEGGMFVFDIFCPAGYPNDPPVMMVYNTGGGKARYNPNLYADGKVCLSLLGTYNSGHTSEKWNPTLSSLYQVLVSIQSQILVTDPMTNEPLSETMAGTAEGSAKTAEYNSRLQLLVMRHAMVDMLLHPPPGTQDIVTRHFHLLRRRIAATVQRWVREAPSEELRGKLDEQAVRLLELLAKL